MEVEPGNPEITSETRTRSEYLACSEPHADEYVEADEVNDPEIEYDEDYEDRDDQEDNDDVENGYTNSTDNSRAPDFPVEISSTQNQFIDPHSTYGNSLNERPPKKKKSSKGKSDAGNTSMTNRSASAKWKKLDPYLQGGQDEVKQSKNSKKIGYDDSNSITLPPIKKQSVSKIAKMTNPKTYKPLNQQRIQKTNSMNINDPIAIQNMEEENKKQKQAKGTEVDYERKNLERLQKIQEKKAQELAMMEEERLKAKEQREKLRQIVFKRAEQHRKIKEEKDKEEEKRKLEESKNAAKPPKKKFVPRNDSKPKPTEDKDVNDDEGEGNDNREETDEQKKETVKIKTYFKNRYISFLKGLKEDNIK